MIEVLFDLIITMSGYIEDAWKWINKSQPILLGNSIMHLLGAGIITLIGFRLVKGLIK